MPQPDYPGSPRWVRGLWLLLALAVVIFVGLHVAGLAPTGGHGS